VLDPLTQENRIFIAILAESIAHSTIDPRKASENQCPEQPDCHSPRLSAYESQIRFPCRLSNACLGGSVVEQPTRNGQVAGSIPA
jgi:hypothetical protein